MMLRKYTNEELLIINPQVKTKKDLFKLLTEHLANKGYIRNRKRFYKSLLTREQIANTEILPHIALPHAGCSEVERMFLLILISREGIDYDHPNFGKVNIIFLFGCDNRQNKEYLRLLAKSARLLKIPQFSDKLINATHKDEVLEIVEEYDKEEKEEESKDYSMMLITLFKKQKLHDLLTAMLEIGVNNAAVINSTSMARRIAYEIPVFAGLSIQSKKRSLETALVISTISEKKIPQKLVSLLKEQELDLTEPGNGFIQLIPTKIISGHIDEFS